MNAQFGFLLFPTTYWLFGERWRGLFAFVIALYLPKDRSKGRRSIGQTEIAGGVFFFVSRIMLFVDKHRPSRLSQLSYHDTLTTRLTSLAADPGGLPHLLLYGPSGAGKKTRVMALLREVFGCGAERLRLEKRTFTTPTKRQVEINMIQSNYHIEMAPGDAGLNDRFVIQDVIKEMAANKNIASVVTSKDGNDGDEGHAKKKAAKASYKVVVLVEVDKLTRQAQAALRRTMEKYSSSCRLILCCNNPSKVIDPVRSRCLGIRVAAPSDDEVSLRRWTLKTFSSHLLLNPLNLLADCLGIENCISQRKHKACRRAGDKHRPPVEPQSSPGVAHAGILLCDNTGRVAPRAQGRHAHPED